MAGRPWTRSSSLWLQLLLVGGVASIALAVIPSWRAATSSQRVAERALADYASFAAWSYRQHAVVAVREMIDVALGAVNHGEGLHESPRIPDAREMGHFLPWDQMSERHGVHGGPMPSHFYAFKLGSDTLAIGVNQSPERGWLADVPEHGVPMRTPDVDRAWLNRRISQLVRENVKPEWGYNFFMEVHDGAPYIIATRLMPTRWGDTIVYAAAYTPRAIDSLFRSVLVNADLLPPALVKDRRNEEMIDLELYDRDGRSLFRTGRTAETDFQARTNLPRAFDSLQVAARVRPELAGTLLIGGTPSSRVPILLVLLVIALGLTTLSAVQLRREARFATERSAFVANVSHELRTPLAQVRLVLDTVRLGRATSESMQKSSLDLADREVLRLQHLVEGLLRFARGSRDDAIPRVAVDVAAEVQQVATEFAPLAAPRGIRIDVTSVAVPTLFLERGALRQMLLNLLDNAVKYGRDGMPVAVAVERDADTVQLSVTDSGPGVAPDERERIWQAYQRGHQARERAAGGSGIGLTIVREIAAAHGGHARVEGAPGGGARFIVTLPVKLASPRGPSVA